MAFARTQKAAKERVRKKRAIRRAGGKIASDATTQKINEKFTKFVTKRRK